MTFAMTPTEVRVRSIINAAEEAGQDEAASAAREVAEAVYGRSIVARWFEGGAE